VSSERLATDEELRRCHDQDLIEFISGCYSSVIRTLYPEGLPEGENVEWLPDTLAITYFPERSRVKNGPLHLKAGLYCCDTSTPIMKFTAEEARKAAALAIDAAKRLQTGEKLIFALCRPPGHHAAPRAYGGFCYYNNAALAADILSKDGKVGILDIDYHHGNGTQEIFYKRNDVYFISLHADPDVDYPYYWGSAEELGEGPGLGFNKNFPLPHGTSFVEYEPHFNEAVSIIRKFDPKNVVVSLGLDAAAGDPICQFLLHPPDYYKMGTAIKSFGKPVLVVQEGGYSADEVLFSCLTAFLRGLSGQ
jgi:acetoin utilization deacetylase AcuC-like enzyme